MDAESPVIECPVDTTISTDIGSCSAVDPDLGDATVSMSCGAVSLFNNAPAVFSVGITEVTYTAVGYNQQTAVCTYAVNVVDAEGPVIFCPDNADLVIPFGQSESYVQLGNAQALDNCGVDTIYNSYNEGGANASGTYALGVTTVVITAEDAAGNSASCEVIVSITEAQQELDTFYISGQIATWAGYPVQDVELSLQGSSTSKFTDEYGDYEIEVFENQTAIVVPQKEEDWLDGVSTLDLVIIQGHILGINTLTGPYAIIAGDANKDGIVSTFDLVLLQNLIIGQMDQIPGNSPWRFVPADYVFDDPQKPFDESFPELKVNAYINQDIVDQDWVAVKTGDASGDAAETGSRETRGHRTFILFAEEDEHGYTTVRFFLPTMEPISGYQIEIFVDPLEYELISYSHAGSVLPNLTDINFFMDVENGILRSNWWYAPGKMPDREELLFEMRLKSLSENSDLTSAIGLNSHNPRFNSEVYEEKGRTRNAAISWKYHRDTRGYSLFQNEPNPFSNATIIPFILPDDMPLQLNIFDAGGRLIESSNLDGTKGINYHPFKPTSPQPGLYYYKLQTGEWTGVKKMIRY